MSQVNLRSEVFWLIEGIFFINWYAIATYALSWLIETLGRLSACLFTTFRQALTRSLYSLL